MSDPFATIAETHGGMREDHEAIAAVIRAETRAFQRQDLAAWKACWVQSPRTQDVYISATAGLTVQDGWPSVADTIAAAFASGFGSNMLDFGQENLRISVDADSAWVVYDGWAVFRSGGRSESFETRFLERGSDGGWKIVYSAVVVREDDAFGDQTIGLDGTGRVIRSSPANQAALKGHPYLTISAGRLRAHRRDWDRALQQAIAQAARHHGFFETHKYSNETGGPAQFPVLLGPTDEGGIAIAHFRVRDGMTYVQIDGDAHLDRRLNAAKTVFGLSDGQLRVARQIAAGESLKGAADKLGISVNTARTHLSRLYEKTGVGTQASLVRLLLSVG